MPDVLIKNVRLLLDHVLTPAEILIEDGRVIGISKEFRVSNLNETIDGKNAIAIPAGIDAHVHFRDPGMTYKESWYTGSCSAAAGGIATVLEHPNTLPPVIDKSGFNEKLKQARKKSVIDFGINGGVTNNLEKLSELWDLGAACFGEIFMAESTGGLNIDEKTLGSALSKIGKLGAVAAIHAEDDALRLLNEALLLHDQSDDVHSRIRPNECEEIAVRKCLAINASGAVPANLHFCHISTPEAVSLIEAERTKLKLQNPFKNESEKTGNAEKIGNTENEKNKKGSSSKNESVSTSSQVSLPTLRRITCEVTPHHLFLSTKDCGRLKTFGKMNPPLRDSKSASLMMNALNSGMINAVASDHAPHRSYEKETAMKAAPSGVPGVETLMPLLLAAVRKNMLSLERMVEVTSRNPARIFDLERVGKGFLKSGFDADILLFHPKEITTIKAKNLHSRCEWTPYEGMDGIFPVMTLSRGDVVWDGQQIIVKKGHGKFLAGAGKKEDGSDLEDWGDAEEDEEEEE
ncbi:dihydroorotase [Methanolapillus ohkumae]|uniref:Dihydroorotase n=1 Tax=Methanolapillus ohkumae TaxID=3028298 RepID=A0AA96V5J4_9EURY|nr:L-hydantoinase [Methanosarcinaceae archaeon Am2]